MPPKPAKRPANSVERRAPPTGPPHRLPSCADFPILDLRKDGTRLVYLDSAATAHVPRVVTQAMRDCYRSLYGPVHRSVHGPGSSATAAYEAARKKVAGFINAASANEIVFVKSATEGLNLIATTLGRSRLQAGDEVILSQAEHHANIVPWHLLREYHGVVLKFAPLADDLSLDMAALKALLTPRTKVIALTHVSNVLGTCFPVREVADLAHEHGALMVVDGAQAVAHRAVDVQALDADFYVFSGHKLYAGGGIGVLYGKDAILQSLPPYLGGGGAILSVEEDTVTFKPSPARYEPGTPPVAAAVTLATAIDYLADIGFETIAGHEQHLTEACRYEMAGINGLKFFADAEDASLISFTMKGIHPHDICSVLDAHGVAIRGGHHCAQPLMRRLGVAATCRASFGVYNGLPDVDALINGLRHARTMFE